MSSFAKASNRSDGRSLLGEDFMLLFLMCLMFTLSTQKEEEEINRYVFVMDFRILTAEEKKAEGI